MAKLVAKNKDAYYNYEIEKEIEAGIVLTGNEVKSIRTGDVSIRGTFVTFKNQEAFIINMHISEYMNNAHDPLRTRKLLLHKDEIKKLKASKEEKGISIVPTKVLLSKKGLVKIQIGIGKGKNLIDKREVIKKRDMDRELKKRFKI